MADLITLTSDDFEDDGELPLSAAHEMVGGRNESPALSWTGLPDGTRSVALTCWDPDAPTTVGFSHWVRFDLPPSAKGLARGAGTEKGEWTDGISDWGLSGYGGMAPPGGDDPHHYIFTVYALSTGSLGLDEHTTYAKFRFMARDKTLATGVLTGRFGL